MRVNVTLEPDMRSPLGGIDSPFGPSRFPSWLLPQVPGNGIQYELTRDQYWLGSGLTAQGNVLSATRASDALLDNTAGVYKLFGPNVPAITDRGLYPGGQRTNFTLGSNDLDNATYYSRAGVTAADGVLAPDGTTTASTFAEAATTSGHNIFSAPVNRPISAGTTYAASIYIRAGTRRYVVFSVSQSANSAYVVVDTQAWTSTQSGTTGSGWTHVSSGVSEIGGGWYRIRLVFTPPTSTQMLLVLAGSSSATPGSMAPSYLGNGSTFIAWQGQLEEASFASPPILTAGAAATRLADSIVNPNYAAHAAAFGFASGMAALARVNLTRLSDPSARRIVTFGTAADGAYIEFTAANTFKAVLRKAGADAVPLTSGTVSATGVYDVTVQFKPGAYSLTVSGGIAGDASASAETLPAAIASACYIGAKEDVTLHTESPLERLALWGVA